MFASSADFACSSASSGVVRTYALSVGLSRSIRSRYARVSSVDEISRRRTAAAWSSADANGSMPANGADSGHRVGRAGQRPFEGAGVIGWNRGEEATAGLRVAEHHLVELGGATPIDLIAIRLVVAAASRGKEVALRQLANPLEEWDRAQVDVGAAGEIGQVSDEPVARDVGGSGRARGDHRLRREAVEGRHDLDRLALQRRWAEPSLDRCGHEP